jgi:hypothetical protein
MALDREGFLSPKIQEWISKHRAQNSAWFALAERLNQVALRQLGLPSIPDNDNQVFLTVLLFMRGLSIFEGAILMAERGMTQEARILARSCFETMFCLAALRKDPAFVEAFVHDDASRRRRLARVLLNPSDCSSSLDAEDMDKLSQFLEELDRSGVETQDLTIAYAARTAELTSIYDVYYRGLSNDSAHPSIVALNRHVDADQRGEIKRLRWGPDVADIEDTLLATCTAAVYLIFWAKEVLDGEEISAELDGCWEEYKRLVGATKVPVSIEGAPPGGSAGEETR